MRHPPTETNPAIAGPIRVRSPYSACSPYLKARTALTVYQAPEKQLAIQKKKATLVDRARAEALVFRLARQELDTWVPSIPVIKLRRFTHGRGNRGLTRCHPSKVWKA
jgi:phage terminase Nu1 subunit (DNA packaging protein)